MTAPTQGARTQCLPFQREPMIHTTSSIYKEKPTMYQDEELLYEVRGPKNITELTAAELVLNVSPFTVSSTAS